MGSTSRANLTPPRADTPLFFAHDSSFGQGALLCLHHPPHFGHQFAQAGALAALVCVSTGSSLTVRGFWPGGLLPRLDLPDSLGLFRSLH